ncbi:Gag-pro-like protein [Cucumis melo var. makuwa]|uniref:Gag-pro-like protein n=1 Tax=Cucumis melo var. makuwa TaxID=1194695 RepID=A0A5A7UC16_CUCMM|nr:Gag-pro-like protein [Cucumis melo var. makuwa]TYK21354.1 Gag-pro-like protein [Cucumis melo var. makuwa]
MEEDKDMDKMRQEINNLGEQVSKILELFLMGKGKVVDTTQSSNPVQDTDDLIYPPGFTPCHMNVPQSQTTQHYVATNPLYVVPPLIPDNAHIHVWKDLADAFLKQYKHNIDMTLDCLDLQRMERKSSESFKEYAQRWRDMAVELYVNENPLPNHENPKVNVVDGLVEKCKNEIHEIVMPMEALFEGLFEAGYVSQGYLDPNIRYEGYDESKHCIFHQGVVGHVVQHCQKFRSKVQQLMDSKILMVYREQGKDEMKDSKICALMDEVSEKEYSFLPRPLTVFYQESRNESTFYNPKKLMIQAPSPFKFKDLKAVSWRYDCQVIIGPSIDNIIGISGITRSGRCYKPDNSTVPSDGLILEQGRKNEKRNVNEHCKDQDVEMSIIAKDIEYKKLVTDKKANEFLKIVKQKPHRKVLLDILNKAHVGHDVSMEKFSGIIGNITSSNSTVFTKFLLKAWPYKNTAYSRRPWIHSAGVVPSTLHQKLKFIVGSKLICVMGEENFLITKPVSTPYVKATEEALECFFCSFEIAHATMMEATVDEEIKPHKSKVEVMTTRIMGGGEYSLNEKLETLLKTLSNDGRFGLGYKSSIYDKIRLQEEKKKKRLAKLEMGEFDPSIKLIPELYDIFKSSGISYSSHNSDLKDDLLMKTKSLSIAAVAQEASFEGNTVYACPLDFELNN